MVLSADPRAAQAAKTAQPAPRRRRARRWHWLVLAIALTALLLFPLYWMLVSSVDSISSLFSVNLSLLPNFGDLGSYAEIFRNYQVGLWLVNSLVITAGSAALSIAVAVPAGYSLSRMKIGGDVAGVIMLFTRVIPGTLLVLPFFIMFSRVNLLNTLLSVIIANTSLIVPLAAWIMKGFFDRVPVDIEEAAAIDGCGLWRTFLLVAVPLVKPGIGATGIYAIVLAWSDYLFPKTLLLSPSHWTLSVGAVSLIGEHTVDWNGLMAMGTIGVLPMVLAFAVLEPYLVSGLTAGATVG
jgi:multiple sugar transport system permease protein